ncbi:secretin N-terminal domain-containing protein [Planctomycetota bacterium]
MKSYGITILTVMVMLLSFKVMTCGAQQSAGRKNVFAPLNKQAKSGQVDITQEQQQEESSRKIETPENQIVWNWDEQKQLLSISVDNMEIRTVLQFLAEHGKLNIVMAQEVQGIVSLNLKDVTWQTVLETVVQVGGCAVRRKDDTLIIFKAEMLSDKRVYLLNFANAREIEPIIQQLVSATGKVGADNRLNSIIVSDNVANLELIGQTIQKLDVLAKQVMIDVLIVNVKLTDELKLGVDWTQLGTSEFFFNQALSATWGTNPSGALNVSTTPGNWNIEGLMDFVEKHDNVSILANPKILVLNNNEATIDSVEEIPYQEKTSANLGGDYVSTSFKDAGIKLKVTPQVTSDGHIIIHAVPEQSAQTGTFTVEGGEIPVIETRKADTTLQVKDGQTIVIAGLRQKQPSKRVSKVPILGDIPLLGLLFQKTETIEIESELAVFITPHIYSDEELQDETSKLLSNIDSSRSLLELRNMLKNQKDK